ncbi:hypothetical protein GCM10027089_26230 [Nocardia thraciensis]
MMRRRQLVAPPPGRRPDLPDPHMKTYAALVDGRKKKKQVWLMRSTDGMRNVFKPFSGEFPVRIGIPETPGAQAIREVAAFRVDRMLGFGRVPATAIVDGPKGYTRGSIQQFIESGPGRSLVGADGKMNYDRTQQQQMAVLDYITGNSDRHAGNYRTVVEDGKNKIVAIDHGTTFPERPDPWGIRSDFVKAHMNTRLDPDVLRAVEKLHPDRLRGALEDLGMSDLAIKGAVDRLQEIQAKKMITGDKWPGNINWSEEVAGGFGDSRYKPYQTDRSPGGQEA